METGLLIDNRTVPAADGATFERRNPVTGQLATRAAAASVPDALAAADAAERAFPAWSALGPTERRLDLLKAASLFEARSDTFVAAMIAETGATRGWAAFNVQLAGNMLREAAALTTQLTGQVIPSDRPGCVSFTVRQPAGTVLGIAPWNAPVILGVRAIAAPLACGNTVILKASELCPRTHSLIGEAFRDAGFPPGVVNVVTNAAGDAPKVVEALIRHGGVRRVNFTGSTRVGKIIARICAEELKPVILELGGKAPLIVLRDANLDEAVSAAAFGAYMNSGQICMSTERIILVEEIADAFVAKFAEKICSIRAGDPADGNETLGSVIDRSAVTTVERLIDDAVTKGAILHRVGDGASTLLGPAFLDRVTPAMAIYSDESFGPVVAIIRVADEAEAVRIANDTAYGLTSSIFTHDAGRGLRLAAKLKAGMCHINGPTVHDEAQMPFGGMNDSGYGRFGGQAGIAEFTDLRWLSIDTQAGHYPPGF